MNYPDPATAFGSAFFAPIVVGKITEALGWKWTFYFVAIFAAPTVLAIFFFCPEVAYRRDMRLNTDTLADEPKLTAGSPLEQPESTPVAATRHSGTGFVLFPTSNAPQPIGNSQTPKKSFVESLSLFTGRKTGERYWVLLLRPFPLLANPAFIWGCLVQVWLPVARMFRPAMANLSREQ